MYLRFRQEANFATQGQTAGLLPWVLAPGDNENRCKRTNIARPMATQKNHHKVRVNEYKDKTKVYTLYWKNGKREVLKGADVIKALREAGYQVKDLCDLSFFTPGSNEEFKWIESSRSWDFHP
jgi:hypothetical protein